jgi:hypothetical protein
MLMSSTQVLAGDPFALMTNPAAVFEAVHASQRLQQLASRVCRPLDKPLIAHADADVNAFDRKVDASDTSLATLM